ncbi:glutathione S-transferase [Limibaculum sp. FT325]|uniref:glutathione S-transferase family protein n=1 Tax=Thermohalobaculum sediminis TaxID=2939436 RepID=UPI0020BDD7D3|nr:glutathione S-transferase [Limibaculum sediminis]MCL5776956.1 glutathione S-transferase [Limibaculum sediminis]
MSTPNLPAPVCLFDQSFAPNPRRVNIFLAEKGIKIERHSLNLIEGEHKAPDYLAKAGIPQVPALELEDGTVLTESQAICRYLEALHPEPNMMGREPLELAVIDMWQRRVEFGLFAAVTATFRHTNPHMAALEDQCPDWGEVNRKRIAGHLARLDARLAGSPYLAADRFTVADITAIVAIDFLKVIREPVPDDLPSLAAWIGRVRARPSCALPGKAA